MGGNAKARNAATHLAVLAQMVISFAAEGILQMISWYLRNASFLLASTILLTNVVSAFGLLGPLAGYASQPLAIALGLITLVLAVTVFVQGLQRFASKPPDEVYTRESIDRSEYEKLWQQETDRVTKPPSPPSS